MRPNVRLSRKITSNYLSAILCGVVAYWISAPIMLGGLAVTLGLSALEQPERGGRGFTRAGVVLGAVGVVCGAVFGSPTSEDHVARSRRIRRARLRPTSGLVTGGLHRVRGVLSSALKVRGDRGKALALNAVTVPPQPRR